MFSTIRNILDKYEHIINSEEEFSDEDANFCENIELHFAIAIRSDLPECVAHTLGKILVDMGE